MNNTFRINNISLPLGYTDEMLAGAVSDKIGVPKGKIIKAEIARKSVDARKKNDVHFIVSIDAELEKNARITRNKKDVSPSVPYSYSEKHTRSKQPVTIAGFGPAGMFAALTLARAGACVTVIERGECVENRIKAVENFRKNGKLDTSTNVQFGEGGAGTFSDGKLTTGTKDMRIRHVFRTFVEHGAPKEILTDAMPHIGTDILTEVVRNIRKEIIALGGNVIFGAKFCGYECRDGKLSAVCYEKDGVQHSLGSRRLILATGHSARDTFEMLDRNGVAMKQKHFAVGVRIEHLRKDVNRSMYGDAAHHPALSAAPYKMAAHLPDGRNVYTFCMCPGGVVIASASEENTVVTNGMSHYARNAENSNSALLVGISPQDFGGEHVLAGMYLQRRIERAAFLAGGGNYCAPVSLVGDFLEHRTSVAFGKVKPSYEPGVKFALPDEYLPDYICNSLRLGIKEFGKKADFFRNCEAVLTGAETRSSSPVTIIRGENLQSVSVGGIYPCGEGAGYAGGIVSAAVDGIKCAEAVIENLSE